MQYVNEIWPAYVILQKKKKNHLKVSQKLRAEN